METVEKRKNGGLVKSIFLPGFADSGSNDTFRPTTTITTSNDNNNATTEAPPSPSSSSPPQSPTRSSTPPKSSTPIPSPHPNSPSHPPNNSSTQSLNDTTITTASTVLGYKFLPSEVSSVNKSDVEKTMTSTTAIINEETSSIDSCQSDRGSSIAAPSAIEGTIIAGPSHNSRRRGARPGTLTEDLLQKMDERQLSPHHPSPHPRPTSLRGLFPMTTPPSTRRPLSPPPGPLHSPDLALPELHPKTMREPATPSSYLRPKSRGSPWRRGGSFDEGWGRRRGELRECKSWDVGREGEMKETEEREVQGVMNAVVEQLALWDGEDVSEEDVARELNVLRDLSKTREGHEKRSQILDYLYRSHAFSQSIKTATHSPSSYLTSPLRQTQITTLSSHLTQKSLALSTLNEELATCRAEIGRLKSAAMAEVLFTSPNRSILDETESEGSSCGEEIGILESAFDREGVLKELREARREILMLRAQVEGGGGLEDLKNDAHLKILKNEKDGEEEAQSENSKDNVNPTEETPNDANDEHTNAEHDVDPSKEEKKESSSPQIPPLLSSSPTLLQALDSYTHSLRQSDLLQIQSLQSQLQSLQNKLSSTTLNTTASSDKFHSVSLDAENFVTEWDDLNIPPPPDHGLRSPIVDALLSQWTSDKSMHHSLLSWMERILSGQSPDSIPPLRLSHLESQIKDGFAMHVLPLLLLRRDVNVEVISRTHRTTRYDVGVTVTGIGGGSPARGDKHMLAWRASAEGRAPASPASNPYQRVVSAPPGRIGVTFVQFRGHAMVSDVSPESPLSGWVFPSDIVIAIDEVPVSGLRVREIVKLLQARGDRQRALRVISSHGVMEVVGGD